MPPFMLSAENEAVARAIARVSAEEAVRVSRADVARGQELVTGAGIPLHVFTLDLSTPAALAVLDVAQMVRSLIVVRGGHAALTLRLVDYAGTSHDIPCAQGLTLNDIPVQGVQVVVPDDLEGTLTILTSEVANAFAGGSPDDQEEYVEITIATAGGAGPIACPMPAELDGEYEFVSASIRTVASGVAGARTYSVSFLDAAGTTTLLTLAPANGFAAGQTGRVYISPAIGDPTLTDASGFVGFLPWAFVGEKAKATNFMVFSIANGDAADANDVTMFFKRKRLAP